LHRAQNAIFIVFPIAFLPENPLFHHRPYAGWCPGRTFENVYAHLMLFIAKCFYSSAEKQPVTQTQTSLVEQPVSRTRWCSGNALVSINAVALRWVRLVVGWVTAFGQVNCLTM